MRCIISLLIVVAVAGCASAECIDAPSIVVTVNHGGSPVVDAEVQLRQDGVQDPCPAVAGVYHCGWTFEGDATLRVTADQLETEQEFVLPSCEEGPTQRFTTEL